MMHYVFRRLLQLAPVLLLMSMLVFVLTRVAPGNPVAVILGTETTAAARLALESKLGLDKPIPLQYLTWVTHAVKGDLGLSYFGFAPVAELVRDAIPVTLELTLLATLVGLLIAVPTGLLAGVRPHTAYDAASTTFAAVGLCLPNFWLAILLIMLFAVRLGWLPSGGFVRLREGLGPNLAHLVLPAVTLGIGLAAPLTRLLRSSMIEVLSSDYVRTARAKGLRESVVLLRHALKNGLLPFVTYLALQLGALLSGTVITEEIFLLPGLGRLMVNSVFQRDYGVIQGVALVAASFFVAMNLAADLTYAYLDPRIRIAR